MRLIGHHRHSLAERHMLSATRPAAQYSGLKGCQVLHQCYLLLLACKKDKLTYSLQEIMFPKAGTSHWGQLELTYLAPARLKVPHLMSIRPKMQEAPERLKKTRSLCVVCRLLAMLRHRKWQFWDLPISVRKSTNIAIWVLVMHCRCLLIEETRLWNADWQC